MKIALLLCTVGWFYGSLLLCTAEDAKLSEHHPLSPPPPHQLRQDDSLYVKNFDKGVYSGDYSDEYNAASPAFTGPYRFLHFGRKTAAPDASYDGFKHSVDDTGAPGGALGEAPSIDVKAGEFELHDERTEVQNLDEPAVSPKTKRSPNRIMHFGKRIPPSAAVDDIADGVKRASHNNILHFGKRVPEDAVADALEHVYSSVDGVLVKRAGNRIMHFGKRGPEYAPSSETDSEQEMFDYYKRAPNRILHFGKRPDYDPEGFDNGYNKRSPLGHRIMHFGKRDDYDVAGLMSSVNEDINAAGKRTMDTRYNYAGRLDQRPSVSGTERNTQRKFQDWKKRFSHRILHFGKRDPEQRAESFAYKRLGNRILHFGKRAGDIDSYSEIESDASTARDKRLKHSIIHFGKREDGLVSVMGGDKRNRIMHFGKRLGSDQAVSDDENPMEKRGGNRILHFGKRLSGFDAPSSSNGHGYGIGDDSMAENAVDKRAHRILHFGKRFSGAAYDSKGLDNNNDPAPSDAIEESGVASQASRHGGQPEEQQKEVPRKKRSVPLQVPESNDDIDDTLAQMMRELVMDEDGYAKRMTMAHSGLSGPLHLPHAYVASQVYGNVFPRMLSRPSRSDRLFRALYSGEHGDKMKPKGAVRNVFLRFG